MKFLLLNTLNFIKKDLVNFHKNKIKEALINKILQDSSSLGVYLITILISLHFLILSIHSLITNSIQNNQFNFNSYLILIFLTTISILLIITATFKLKHKIKIYKKITTIKKNTDTKYIFSSLIDQLKTEQSRLSSKNKVINHK